MMTQQLEVSILAAPLGAIDRRALSQAWYTALRLVPRAQQTALRTSARSCAIAGFGAHSRETVEAARSARAEVRRLHAVPVSKPAAPAGNDAQAALPRRRPALAVRIERVFAESHSQPKRATFSLGRGNARVHIILQTKGERTTLLAVCRPELRAVVARALAQARLTLAARGIGVEVQSKGGRACS